MRLYKMELYKLCRKKVFLAGIVLAAGLMLLYFWFVEVGDEIAVVEGRTCSGYEAVQVNRGITKEFAGAITDEKIVRIVEKYGLPSKLEDNMPGWRDGNYLNDFVVRYFTDGSWEQRVLPTELFSLKESVLGSFQSRQGTGPTLAYTKGWLVFTEMLSLGLMLGSVLVLCGVSVVFAEESTTRMQALIFTAKEGRRKDIAAKILASFTLTAFLFAGIVLLSFLLCRWVYGLDGFGNPAGLVLLKSIFTAAYSQSFARYLGLMLVLGAQALFSLCALTLYASACCGGTFSAVVAATAVWAAPVLLRMFMRGAGALLIYAMPIFLIMNGMLNDVYQFWPVVSGLSLALSMGGTAGSCWKYKRKYT